MTLWSCNLTNNQNTYQNTFGLAAREAGGSWGAFGRGRRAGGTRAGRAAGIQRGAPARRQRTAWRARPHSPYLGSARKKKMKGLEAAHQLLFPSRLFFPQRIVRCLRCQQASPARPPLVTRRWEEAVSSPGLGTLGPLMTS